MAIKPPKPREDDDDEELDELPELDFDENSELDFDENSELIVTAFVPVNTVEDFRAQILNQWPVVEKRS